MQVPLCEHFVHSHCRQESLPCDAPLHKGTTYLQILNERIKPHLRFCCRLNYEEFAKKVYKKTFVFLSEFLVRSCDQYFKISGQFHIKVVVFTECFIVVEWPNITPNFFVR